MIEANKMDLFYSFACQQVSKNPLLIGESSSSIQEISSYCNINSGTKKLLSTDAPACPSADEAMNSVVMRSLIAPLNPCGIGHLVYSVIWPSVLAAEACSRKLGKRKRERELGSTTGTTEESTFLPHSATEDTDQCSHEAEEQALIDYLESMNSLNAAFEETRKKIRGAELYLELSSHSRSSAALLCSTPEGCRLA